MSFLVLALVLGAILVAVIDGRASARRRRARGRRVEEALADPARRDQAIAALAAEARALEQPGGLAVQLLGRRGRDQEKEEARLLAARLELAADRPQAALERLSAIDPNRLPRRLQTELALHAVEAHLRLSEWDAAERVLDGYSSDGLSAAGRALRANARARIRLGRGDARSALRVLDEIDPVPDEARAELDRTRAAALAALGKPRPA